MFKRFIKPSLTVARFYHSHYQPECCSVVKIQSMCIDISKIKNFRLNGIPLEIEYYDSHRFNNRLKYDQSILPTVLILPSGEKTIQDYEHLYGELTKLNYRVLSISLPGW